MANLANFRPGDRHAANVVIEGQVEATVKDQPGQDLVKVEKETQRQKAVTIKDPFIDKDFKVNKPVIETSVEEVPTVVREAALSLTYTLIAENGRVIKPPAKVSSQLTRKYGGVNEKSGSGLPLAQLPKPEETIVELARQLATKLAETIAPSPAEFKIVLDKGEGLLGEKDIVQGLNWPGTVIGTKPWRFGVISEMKTPNIPPSAITWAWPTNVSADMII
jgi:hypothetical protein